MSLLTIGNINVPPASIGDTVTFQTAVYRKSIVQTQYTYALQGNPWGSYIDPNTGAFTWIPHFPGVYSFYVWVADQNDMTQQAYQQVTITVSPSLGVFGYSIFAKARMVINTRMLLVKSGMLQGVTTLQNLGNGNGPAPLLLSQNNGGPGSGPNGGNGFQNQFASLLGNGGGSAQNPFSPSNLFGYGPQANSLAPQGQTMSALVPGAFIPPITPFGPSATPTSQGGGGLFGQSPSQGGQQGSGQGQQGQGMSSSMGMMGMISQNGTASGASSSLSDQSKLAIIQSLLGNGTSSGAQAMQQQGYGSGGNGFIGAPTSPFSSQGSGFGSGMGSGMGGGGSLGSMGGLSGFQMPGSMDISSMFNSNGPNGLSILPSNGFASLGNLTMSGPQQNGMPYGNAGLTANALQYLVGPLEEMGMNVYLPYPDRYQLGAGDLLTARIWSTTMQAQDFDLKVDSLGHITLPGDNDKIVLRGLTLSKAQDVLKQRVSVLFKHGQITLTLKALRTMSVQVLGDAYMPGSYQVPAVATLFNTLIVCGGPTDQGSLRRIELRRNDGTKQVFDLYDYLTKGDTKADVPLQPGDVIFIPTVTSRVNVKGEVTRPAIYETLATDTLQDLLAYAGGSKSTGVTQRIELDTEDSGVGHTVKDVDLSKGNPPASLFDGDTLTVYSVRDEVLNELNLEGAVDQPGTFEYRKGMTVADLITRARGLLKDAYKVRADLYRQNPDQTETIIPIMLDKAMARQADANIELKPHDRVKVYHVDDAVWQGDRKLQIAGAVQRPGPYNRQDGERLMDLLLQAGGVTGDAFLEQIVVQRTNPDGTMGQIFRINLKKLAAGDESQNILLQDDDAVSILTVKDSMFVPDQTVSILGAVQNPGAFPRGAGMKLSDAVHLSGGFMPNVGDAIEIKHARTSELTPSVKVRVADLLSGNPNADIQLSDGDLITVPEDANIELHPRKVIVVGEVNHPGPYTVNSADRLSDVITRAGGPRPTAFIDGTQFYRDPTQLISDTQARLMPQIVDTLRMVAQDEFSRALAYEDVQKIRLVQSGGPQTSSSLIPLLSGGTPSLGGGGGGGGTVLPQGLWDEKTATQARDISNLLTPSGNMSVHLRSALKHRGSADDITLADGDIIVIPKTPSTTTVLGAVAIPSGILYVPGKTVGYYVDRAGGFAIDAAKDRMILIRADGVVEKASMKSRVQLGDQLLVPTHVMAAKFDDKATEIDAISKQVTAGAIVIAVLRSLFK